MTADGKLFVCVFVCVFSSFLTAAGEAYDSGREAHTGAGKAYDSRRGAMTADGKLITGAGKAYDSGRGGLFVCVSFFFLFMKAILSFLDFWTIFCCFYIFLFIFALTFHKCQIVMKAILSFF